MYTMLKKTNKTIFKIIFNTSTTYHIQDRKDIHTGFEQKRKEGGEEILKNF